MIDDDPNVTIARAHEEQDFNPYDDTIVTGLRMYPRCSWRPESTWSFKFESGIVYVHEDIGIYPRMSLDEARVRARTKQALIEQQIAPPTGDEIGAYNLALNALKSGDQSAREDVLHGFVRIAQVPEKMRADLTVKLHELPPADALLTCAVDLLSDEVSQTCRISRALSDSKIETVAQLLLMSDAQLLRLPNIGRKSLNEVKQAVRVFLAAWPTAAPIEPSLSTLVALQKKIIATLEQQTVIMYDVLSLLERLER
jgi:hypothetical protein